MCIFYVELLWEYLAICRRAHNHSLTSPERKDCQVHCTVQKSQIFSDLLPMANVASAMCIYVCVVSLSCLHLLILYSNFRLMHMTLIRLHPVGGLDSSLPRPAPLPPCACPPLVYHCHIFFWLGVCKGNRAFKALYLFTPLTHVTVPLGLCLL